jgi:TRAP transporter TAXI family solute receptor
VAFASQSDPSGFRHREQGKRALAAWVWLVGFSLAALVATYVLFVEPPPPRTIVIASGSRNGAYYRYAQQYAAELRKEHLTVDVRETTGSVENLHLLGQADSDVSVAIVQGGVASAEDIDHFFALGSLYREPLWVFYRGDARLERISQLRGKRVGIGPAGSGTQAIAVQLLRANGLIDSRSAQAGANSELVQDDVVAAAKAVREGTLDTAFFVAAFEADYIQSLLTDRRVKLLSFGQQEAYHRRFRFLAPVTLPAGMVNLAENIPGENTALLAPTAMLVVRKNFHPALVPLLLATATRIHGRGDVVSNPGEFPSPSYCDFSVSEDAARFYKSGQPVLQRLLPFWVASMIDRTKVMLIPLVMLLMPLLRTAPPLMRWRTRRKIYRWYADLRQVDRMLATPLSLSELERELAGLKEIERKVANVDVPLSYMEEFYHLRMHLALLQHVIELRARSEPRLEP